MPLKAIVLLLGTAIFITLAYFFSLFAIHGFSPDFLEINKCIESGGRWNYDLRTCEKLPGIYTPPDPNAPQE
jgi:hypothetical protein